MSNKKKGNKKKSSIPKAFLIPICILTVSFVILLVSFIGILAENRFASKTSVNSFYYQIEGKEYFQVYDNYVENDILGVNPKDYTTIYALGEYWKNSFLEKGLAGYKDVSGYTEKKEAQRANLGIFESSADGIDEMLK